MKSVLSHESDAGRGHTEPLEGVPQPCMPQCRHILVSLSSEGATAGDGRGPLEKLALAAGSAASGHNSPVTKCKVLSSHLSPEFFLCLWDQVSSSTILSNYFIFS